MEGYRSSSYGDAFADVYDTWYREVGDLEGCATAVAEMASRLHESRPDAPTAVLELGSGTGRLALAIRERGCDVVGVDASSAMIEQMRHKVGANSLPVVTGDITALPFAGPFAGAVIAFNTLFNIDSADAQQDFFHEIFRVLTPGGFLAAELFVPSKELDAPDAVLEPGRIEIDRVVLTASIRDRHSQVVEGQHIEIAESGIRLRPWRIRYASPDEVDSMASVAGLALEARFSNWRGDAFDACSEQHISWWRKP